MSVDLKKRFDRIVDILIQLQSKRIVKAQELADRFEVSLRTIYRDIKSLEQAGVPIIGEAGTGYSITDGYKLPPVIFSKEEALSFIGAEKLMEKFMDSQMIEDFKSAVFKIKSVLKYAEKDLVSTLYDQIQISASSYEFFNKSVPHALRTFFKSVATKKQVIVEYKGVNDAASQIRHLEPIGLYHNHGFWYIVAFCTSRQDYRQFRADRIRAIEPSDKNFEKERLSLDDFLQKQQNNSERIRIRILTSIKMASYLQWERLHFGFTKEIIHDQQIEMIFDYAGSMEYFGRWFMMFADDSEIIEPLTLKYQVEEILSNSIKKIATPSQKLKSLCNN